MLLFGYTSVEFFGGEVVMVVLFLFPEFWVLFVLVLGFCLIVFELCGVTWINSRFYERNQLTLFVVNHMITVN